MADQQKIILMIQPTRLQGLIWQAALKSQKLAVIWESADFDLQENLSQLAMAGLPLPSLLLIDMRLKDFNPYAFCRWCRDHYPDTKIVLTNSAQQEIEPSERQWAISQGAVDLMCGFSHDNLVTGVTTGVKRILQVMDNQPLNNATLIAVLFAMKRELEVRKNKAKTVTKENGTRPSSRSSDTTTQPWPKSGDHGDRNGHDSSSGNQKRSKPMDSSQTKPEEKTETSPETSGVPRRRRYRGIKY
jgi:CheY-like chemotaxis protein